MSDRPDWLAPDGYDGTMTIDTRTGAYEVDWPSPAELENLSNSIGTTDAELTIEDMQRVMTEIAATCRVNREEAQAKADEAYLRLRMEPLGSVNAYLLDGGRALSLAFEDDCLALFEKVAPRSWLKRRAQRAARRVRMARKRRRGWA